MSQNDIKICVLKVLPEELKAEANRLAVEENPDNMPNEDEINTTSGEEMANVIGKRWSPGRTIKVSFMDGDPAIHAKVEEYAHKWEQYANIHFAFVKNQKAEIRISFKEKGSWSYLGTDCLTIPENEPTMNYGWFDRQTKDIEYSRTVIHEFGHALACPHEHSSPSIKIPWDVPAVYRYFMGPPNNWPKEVIDRNVLFQYNFSQADASRFDPNSIMVYEIPNSLTIGDFEVKSNTTLSEMDKEFIQRMYPGRGNANRPFVAAGIHEKAANPIEVEMGTNR